MNVWVLTITTSYGLTIVDSAHTTMEGAKKAAELMWDREKPIKWEIYVEDDSSICGCFTMIPFATIKKLVVYH